MALPIWRPQAAHPTGLFGCAGPNWWARCRAAYAPLANALPPSPSPSHYTWLNAPCQPWRTHACIIASALVYWCSCGCTSERRALKKSLYPVLAASTPSVPSVLRNGEARAPLAPWLRAGACRADVPPKRPAEGADGQSAGAAARFRHERRHDGAWKFFLPPSQITTSIAVARERVLFLQLPPFCNICHIAMQQPSAANLLSAGRPLLAASGPV